MIKQKGLLLSTIVKGDMETATQCNNKLATCPPLLSPAGTSYTQYARRIGNGICRSATVRLPRGSKILGRQMRLFSIFSILEVSKFVFGFFRGRNRADVFYWPKMLSAVAVHFFVILLIVAARYLAYPLLVFQVPTNGLYYTVGKARFGQPA